MVHGAKSIAHSDAALAALRLSLVRGVGACIGRQLFEACDSFECIWQYSAQDWAQIDGVGSTLIEALKQSNANHAMDIARQCQAAGIHILCWEDELYPQALKETDDAPLVLFVIGNLEVCSDAPCLAVVGARKSSRESRVVAKRWSQYFSNQGIIIVSGMAYGIDASAHSGALAGQSPTVAVLGCGLLALQQRQQAQVQAIVEHGGCVISEYMPEQTPRPEYFPSRNRIIAGLSQATLVVEADIRSGSLITANRALGYGREVLAVPGSVLAGGHEGCHQLIRDGAYLVDAAEQVLQCMGWHAEMGGNHMQSQQAETEDEQRVLDALNKNILHLDALSDACGLTVPELSPILLALELRGVIERLSGSRYTLGGK